MKKIIFLFLIVHCTFVIDNCLSQPAWVQLYNGPGNLTDNGNSIAVDLTGNVYVTGSSTGSGSGNDIATIKYNSSGVQQWVQRYNGPGNSEDLGSSIAVDLTGNVYVTGGSYGSGTLYDYVTIKYNSSGDTVWVRRYDGPGNRIDVANAITLDALGNVYVTGQSSRGNFVYDRDYATIKYNSAGVQQWVARYSGPVSLNNNATSIAVDGSGNVYITGGSEGGITTSNFDYATIKYNSAGVQQWVARYDTPINGADQANSLTIDGLGNVYVTGYSYSGTTQRDDYVTIKYNSAGDSLWLKRYVGPNFGNDRANVIKLDVQGNSYVTGYSEGGGTGDDYLTVKYSSAGGSLWVKRYNGPGNDVDRANSMVLDSSGIYITGYSRTGFLGSTEDYVTLKYNFSGTQLWLQRYNGTGNSTDQAKSIAVDVLGNVYVTGFASTSTQDYATIKYSATIGIKPISNEIPNQFSLSQNYPNPFNPTTNIKFSIPKASFVKLVVYDITGREVETLVNENFNAGTFNVDWDASKYSSGVYFYKLSAADYTETKKMVLVK